MLTRVKGRVLSLAVFVAVLAASAGCVSETVKDSEPLVVAGAGIEEQILETAVSAGPEAGRAPLAFPTVFPDPPRVVKVPILMYHHVGDPAPDDSDLTRRLTVSLGAFDQQMSYLNQAGFETIGQEQLFRALYEGEALPPRPVLLTFDDGFMDNYRVALPTLEKYGHRATFYVITGKIGVHKYMGWDQLLELDRRGMDIGSHTASHPDLRILDAAGQEQELAGSAAVLAGTLGHPVHWLCYPAGAYDRSVLEHAWGAGYLLAVTTEPGNQATSNGSLRLPRYRIGPGTTMEEFAHLVE